MIKMKKQNIIPIIALLALVSMMIVLVSAETLTGSIISTQWSQTTYIHGGITGDDNFHQLAFFDIEKSTNLISIVRWEHALGTIDAGAPEGISIPVTVKLCTTWDGDTCSTPGATIGSGDLGYQRVFDNNRNEKAGGYQYFVVNTLNVTGLSGDIILYLEYSNADFYNKTTSTYAGGAHTSGAVCFSGQLSGGAARCVGTSSAGTLVSKDVGCTVSYSVTKPASIGIAGSVQKTSGSSKMSLYDGATGVQLANEQLFSSFDYWNFSTVNNTIILGMLNTGGTQVNTSTLFSVTPTPTPTPTPIIPAGYVRSTFVTIDGVNYNTIHGSNIMLYDVENGSWSISTSDADGIFYINTLPYHTINAYATYTIFANHYADASIIGAVTGNSGMDYPIYMFPPGLPPGPGNINLYIPVVDASTSYAIGSVGVQVELPTGAITGDITGPGGDAAVFVVPNNTIIKARASKTGYGPVTESFNSGEVSPKTKTLSMYRLVVTTVPTATIGPGGTTPVYVDPRNDTKKATDAFSKWMNVLGDITDIVIGVVIIWLMWITVYMITGGKIIDKIMKRGRR